METKKTDKKELEELIEKCKDFDQIAPHIPDNWYPQVPAPASPCPGCGACPYCGRRAYPQRPYYTDPIWISPYTIPTTVPNWSQPSITICSVTY